MEQVEIEAKTCWWRKVEEYDNSKLPLPAGPPKRPVWLTVLFDPVSFLSGLFDPVAPTRSNNS
ncbi:unnamed protein product [Rhodiola kirilowii]